MKPPRPTLAELLANRPDVAHCARRWRSQGLGREGGSSARHRLDRPSSRARSGDPACLHRARRHTADGPPRATVRSMTRPADSAIFAGTCTLCDGPIERGHRVAPKGDGWVHRSCWSEAHE